MDDKHTAYSLITVRLGLKVHLTTASLGTTTELKLAINTCEGVWGRGGLNKATNS